MRCAACNVILTDSEMRSDKEDGTINDICYTCQPYIDDPDFCYDRDHQFQEITELFYHQSVTPPRPDSDRASRKSRNSGNFYV